MSKRYLGGDIYFEQKESSQEFSEESEGGGGSSTLAGLTDVDISNPTDGQTLVYNAESDKWENGAGGASAYFVDCVYSIDEFYEVTMTSSKTAAEIRAAMESGALVYIRYTEPGDVAVEKPDINYVHSLSTMSYGTADDVTMAMFGFIAIKGDGSYEAYYTDYTAMTDNPVFVISK